MTHREITKSLNQDLDDLEVRNPNAYHNIERRLKILESEAGFEVAKAPIIPPGTKSMERTK